MGIFSFFTKKKETQSNKRIPESILGFILLETPVVDWEQFKKNLREDWEILVNDKETNEGQLVLQVDGSTVVCGFMDAPVPNGEAEEAAKNNIFWKEGVENTKKHKAHIILNILNGKTEIEQSLLFVKIAASFLKLDNAIGIYKYPTVIPSNMYIEVADEIKEGRMPLANMIHIGIYSNGQEISGYTQGLKYFGKEEIEVIESKNDFFKVYDFLYKISNYIIKSNVTLKHGETIGFSAEEKLGIILSKGVAVEGESLKINY